MKSKLDNLVGLFFRFQSLIFIQKSQSHITVSYGVNFVNFQISAFFVKIGEKFRKHWDNFLWLLISRISCKTTNICVNDCHIFVDLCQFTVWIGQKLLNMLGHQPVYEIVNLGVLLFLYVEFVVKLDISAHTVGQNNCHNQHENKLNQNVLIHDVIYCVSRD